METNDFSRFDTELKFKVAVDKTDDGIIRFALLQSDDCIGNTASPVLATTGVKIDRLKLDDITDETFINEVVKLQLIKFKCHIRSKLLSGKPILYVGSERKLGTIDELTKMLDKANK